MPTYNILTLQQINFLRHCDIGFSGIKKIHLLEMSLDPINKKL